VPTGTDVGTVVGCPGIAVEANRGRASDREGAHGTGLTAFGRQSTVLDGLTRRLDCLGSE
jgi:hypothetical protein